jgi:large subunit ribosomal protein L32e
MPKPVALTVKKIKKHPHTFKRYQANRFMRISRTTWRKPKGIDSKVRRRYRGYDISPKIGYGTNAAHRHVLPSGFKKFRVSNVAELDVLLMQNRTYAAEIAHNVGARKRIAIVERAKQLDIKVLNGDSRVRKEQDE